jgi:hypothetical protein
MQLHDGNSKSRENSPIYIYLYGGLGNQIFQLSLAMGLSRHREVVLSTAQLSKYRREMEIHKFARIAAVRITDNNCHSCEKPKYQVVGSINTKNLPCCILSSPGHANWLGHIINPELFFEILKDGLEINIPSQNFGSEIVIHFRLGDYLFPTAAGRYGILKTSYFSRILEIKKEKSKIEIVTDDILAFNRIHRKSLLKWDLVFPKNRTPLADFKAMCVAPIFIASNSTLSFWASWFRDQLNLKFSLRLQTFVPSQIYRRHSIEKMFGIGVIKPEFWNPVALTLRYPWIISRRLKWKDKFWI